MARVYVSSTYSDLVDYREAVYKALRGMRNDVIAMEDYRAEGQRPLHKCLADVKSCDLYIGIFAWRYGYIPAQDNPESKSITELEYRKAFEMGKECLIFLLEAKTAWPPDAMDMVTGEGGSGARIRAFREELQKSALVDYFKTAEELANLVSQAVANWQRSHGDKDPIVVTSKILDVDYMVTVDQSGRSVLVPASGHIVRLTVEATDSRTAIIQNLCPIVLSRSEATGSLSPRFGIVTPRPFEVLLDERPPCLKPTDLAGPNFPFKVGPGDPEVFDLKVLTSAGDVKWWLELSWTSLGQEGTLRVDLGGSPFRTMARPKRVSAS